MDKGYIRLYTGDGKGKTTMALGLALRFAGAGKRVFIGQFIKDDPRGDIMALRKAIPGVVTAQFGCGTGCICGREPDAKDVDCAKKVWRGRSRRLPVRTLGLWCLTKSRFRSTSGLSPSMTLKSLLR